MKIYKHTKSGRLYLLLGEAKNCTNSNDGQEMMYYCEYDAPNPKYFVREKAEFLSRFEPLNLLDSKT